MNNFKSLSSRCLGALLLLRPLSLKKCLLPLERGLSRQVQQAHVVDPVLGVHVLGPDANLVHVVHHLLPDLDQLEQNAELLGVLCLLSAGAPPRQVIQLLVVDGLLIRQTRSLSDDLSHDQAVIVAMQFLPQQLFFLLDLLLFFLQND